MRTLAPVLTLVLAGCLDKTPVEAAPEDFDGNVHFLWDHYDGTDHDLIDALNKLHVIVQGDTRTEVKKGGLKDISADDAKVVMMRADADPTAARGMYLINVFKCTLDKVETITIAQNQADQYTGVYDSYVRTYTSSQDDYTSRKSATLTWKVDLSAKLLDAAYSSTLSGGVRRVTPSGTDTTPFGGPVLMVRTWLPNPATFKDMGPTFDQDYQLEVYYERKPGELMHVYPMWRHMAIPSVGLSTDDDSVVNITTTNLQKWDENTATLCAK